MSDSDLVSRARANLRDFYRLTQRFIERVAPSFRAP
jgi:hypothetical protein